MNEVLWVLLILIKRWTERFFNSSGSQINACVWEEENENVVAKFIDNNLIFLKSQASLTKQFFIVHWRVDDNRRHHWRQN